MTHLTCKIWEKEDGTLFVYGRVTMGGKKNKGTQASTLKEMKFCQAASKVLTELIAKYDSQIQS